MQTVPHQLVTIIAERVVRDRIVETIHRLGATGHTLTDVTGEGARGGASGTREMAKVRIETIAPPAVADRIVEYVAETFFAHHSVIVYLQTVAVVRGSKYAPQNEEA